MSASLVGSEMCIRDSKRPRILHQMADGQAPTVCMPPSVHPYARPSKRHTVSYTHLTLPTICSV
eukprot:14200018-Alexandrium_andersonii.AAC.1